MVLPPDRLERFARHIVLPEVGGAGQAALASSTVVLIGVAGYVACLLSGLAVDGHRAGREAA